MTAYTWVYEALKVELGPVDGHANIAEQATPTHETYYTMPWDEDGD